MRALAPLLALALILGPQPGQAKGFRRFQVPNGDRIGCALCHRDPQGGGRRNLFGEQVEARFLIDGNVDWGPGLAAEDADGDGASNGEELGDPLGRWRPGDPAPTQIGLPSLPYDADSRPPTTSAIRATPWARVKAASAWHRWLDAPADSRESSASGEKP